MKPAQVNKLYSKLTPHEQAALVIEAASRGDTAGLEAIVEQVERRQYITCHADYLQRINELMALVGQYSVEYWKTRALMLVACNLIGNDNNQSKEAAKRFFDKTIALELALVDACKMLKVDAGAIKKMADCIPGEMENHQLPKVDEALVKQYQVMFGVSS